MAKKITDSKITQSQFDKMTAPLEQDLFAYFKVLEELIMSETFDNKRSPESLIEEITGVLSSQEETGSIVIQKDLVKKEDRPTHYRFFQGMLIGIENQKGTVRSGIDPDGHRWQNKMDYDYGFIFNTAANDGDSVDGYLGLDEKSEYVFVIRQVDPVTKEFDEIKVMLGFPDKKAAMIAYRNQYDKPDFFGGIMVYTIKEFKKKIFGGKE